MNEKIYVKVRRNSIWITPYILSNYKNPNECTCRILDRHLSTFDLGKKRYELALNIYDKDTKTIKIPKGYGLDNIINRLNSKNNPEDFDFEKEIEYVDETNDFVKPITVEFQMNPKFKIKDKIQADAINFLLTVNNNAKLLTLGTGYGKTFCAVYATCKRKVPAIVISSNLSEQWIQRIKDYTNLTDKNIVNLRGMKSLEKILNSKPNTKIPFFIVSTSTLNLFLKNGGNLNQLFQKMGIGIKIFDEAHTFYSQNAKIDVNSDTVETFYLTATPERSALDEKRVFDRIFKEIPTHGIYTHYIDNHYILRAINYNTFPTPREVSSCMIYYKKFFSANLYSKYIFSNEERTLFYCGMIKMLADALFQEPNMKILIIVPVLEHLAIIKNFLKKTSRNLKITEYTSNVDISDRENSLKGDIILSTLKSFKEGRDVKGLKAIFALQSFSSTLIAQQLLGRLRKIEGENTYYYDFVDLGFRRMVEHREARKREFLSRSRIIQKRNISNSEVFEYLRNL